MNAKSGNHFCDKIMLKPLILREFFFDQVIPPGRNAR
jgi:hypothetical protein